MRRIDNWNVDLGQINRLMVSDLKEALGAASYAEFIIPALREKYGTLININEMRRREAEALKTEQTA